MKSDEELNKPKRPRRFIRSNRWRWYRTMADYNNAKRIEEFTDCPKEVEKTSKDKAPFEEEDTIDTNFSDDDFQVIVGNSPMILPKGEKRSMECNMVLYLPTQYRAFPDQPSS